MDDSTVVNYEAEQTVTPSTSGESTQSNYQESNSQSREDNNTQFEQNQNNESDLADKSYNRFQELANQNKELEQRLSGFQQEQQNWELTSQQMEQQLREAQSRAGGDQLAEIWQAKVTMQEAELSMMKEEKKWEEAFTQFPEIKQDRQLDDFVYSTYLAERNFNPRVTPKEIAEKVIGFINNQREKAKEDAYGDAEKNVTEKMQQSVQQNRRGQTQAARAAKSKQDAYDRLASGDESVIDGLLNY